MNQINQEDPEDRKALVEANEATGEGVRPDKAGSVASQVEQLTTRLRKSGTLKREKNTTLTAAAANDVQKQVNPLSFNECPLCDGRGFFMADLSPGEPGFGRPIRCEGRQHLEERLAQLARWWDYDAQDQGIRLADVSPQPKNRAMLAAAATFLERPRGWLYIWGGPGNAKTVILKALVNELNLAGAGPARYIKFTKLVNHMREAFSQKKEREQQMAKGMDRALWSEGTYMDRFERLKRVPILAIDEFDKARMTDFADEFRFDFLDDRYEQAVKGQTCLIFASQQPPAHHLPKPVTSRFEDGRFQVINNLAGDSRRTMRWEDAE